MGMIMLTSGRFLKLTEPGKMRIRDEPLADERRNAHGLSVLDAAVIDCCVSPGQQADPSTSGVTHSGWQQLLTSTECAGYLKAHRGASAMLEFIGGGAPFGPGSPWPQAFAGGGLLALPKAAARDK